MIKILRIALILVVLVATMGLSNASYVSATIDFDKLSDKAKQFIENGTGGEITEQEAINQLVPIGQILVGIASIVLVVAGLVLAVRYMLSGADEKAKLKEKLIWYVISIVLVYGAVGIYNIVTNVMNTILAN